LSSSTQRRRRHDAKNATFEYLAAANQVVHIAATTTIFTPEKVSSPPY